MSIKKFRKCGKRYKISLLESIQIDHLTISIFEQYMLFRRNCVELQKFNNLIELFK